MKLYFLGANRQVTGSRYVLEAAGLRILIDCGLFQERPYQHRNWEPSPVPPGDIDVMLLTHAHLDHCGLIPKLVREGFRGPIYCTEPTVSLSGIILQDSAEIQAEDVAYKQKRHARERRTGDHPAVALYSEDDVDRCLAQFRGVGYRQPVRLGPNVSATFYDAGHILGSAMVEIVVNEQDGTPSRILFSGDIGQWNKPIIHDPTLFRQADYVVMESTYGDRNHQDGGDIETELARVIHDTASRGGNVVIPTFAVERAQELMWYISRLVHADRIPDLPIYLDSPMSVDVTGIFAKFRNYFDQETWQLIQSHESPLKFPGLRFAHTVEESKAINRGKGTAIIMASSGMCTAGRIKHHLRANLGRPESTVLFVGYQSAGTLGRQILDGQHFVRIHGEMIKVKAHVEQIFGFSGHADQTALLRWLQNLKQPPKRVFLTHGEEDASFHLANHIQHVLGWPVIVPVYQEAIELDASSPSSPG
ncbi:MAG: MBL fold metallo-hydrolase RNA specificity domain-containing protein [Pirellulaceae bacterium]